MTPPLPKRPTPAASTPAETQSADAPPPVTPRPLDILTYSQLSTLRQCPRKAYYRYELCLERENRPGYFRMGSAYHAGQEAFNNGMTEAQAIGAALQVYENPPESVDLHDWEVERETVHQLLVGHFWRHANDVAEVLATELKFEVPLVNPDSGRKSQTFIRQGKIDAIVRLTDGRVAVKEYKTTSEDVSSESMYWLRLRGDTQISDYMLAARALGFDPQCVIYDVTRKPSISPRQIPILDDAGEKIVLDAAGQRVLTKQGKPRQTGDTAAGYVLQTRVESAEEFGKRLLADIGERPDFYYARREVPRTDADLREAAVELWQQADELRERRRQGRWFRNVTERNCNHCDYVGICLGGVTIDIANPPSGFRIGDKHPELMETP